MSTERVTMRNAATKATIQAPATAVKVYERSGWTLVKDEDAKADTPTPDPAPAGSKTRTAGKEESK